MGARRGLDGLTDKERKICLAVDSGLTDREAHRAACPNSKATDHSAASARRGSASGRIASLS